MNFDRLRFVAERAGLGENSEALISVVIPERPSRFINDNSSFVNLYSVIHPRSVTEFSYRFGDASRAHIFMSFSIANRDTEIDGLFKRLREEGMEPMDASHNEMAKAHARYLVGGRRSVPDERLFRFSFPERPGALAHFLGSIKNPSWNISLFHYRNYGGDVAKVMVGIQVPPPTEAEFERFLGELGYPHVEETSNPIYQNFLR
jgi:threonine dehydratase